MASGLRCRQRARRQKTVARSRMRSWRSWRWGWRGRRRCWGGRRGCCVPQEASGGQTSFFRFLMPLRPGDISEKGLFTAFKMPVQKSLWKIDFRHFRSYWNKCQVLGESMWRFFWDNLKQMWCSAVWIKNEICESFFISRGRTTPIRNDTRAQSCAEILHIVWSWSGHPGKTWDSMACPGTQLVSTGCDTDLNAQCATLHSWMTKLKCTFYQTTCQLDWTFMKSNKRP